MSFDATFPLWQLRHVHSSSSTSMVEGLVPFSRLFPAAPLCERWQARQLCIVGVSSAKPAAPMSSCQGFIPAWCHTAAEVLCIDGFVDQYLLSWHAEQRLPLS